MEGKNADAGNPLRVLIVGGGFAGLDCAQHLANDDRFAVTLVDRHNHHLFQPLLYQVATASLAAPDIARSLRQILSRARNVTVLMDEITEFDLSQQRADGKSGKTYDYDYLVLAAGARTSFFGNEAWRPHLLELKSLADAQEIRRRVLRNLERAELSESEEERSHLMTVAIVGGGPTGVELAGAFTDLVHRSLRSDYRHIDTSKLRVVLIEGLDRLLSPYDPEQSAYAEQRLRTLGVEVRTGTKVSAVTEECLQFEDGSVLNASVMIWAAGTEAHPLTRDLGVPLADKAGRLAPEADLSLPGHPEVFVAGDLAAVRDKNDDPIPGVAPAAMQMGKHVAKVLKEEARLEGTDFAERKIQLRPRFKYFDKGIMAIIGKNAAVVKSGKLRFSGFLAWLAWLLVHLLFLVGFRNKLSVLLGWAYAYLCNKPETRIIISGGLEEESKAPRPDEGKPAKARPEVLTKAG